MPFSETKEGVITYQQGQKWSAVGPWLVNVISGAGIGLPGARMGALLADAFNSKTAACWRTNARMAETLGTSVSSVIEGLRQLERNGHIVLVMEPRNGKLMRHIYPKANAGRAKREVRDPHGGVPKGTQPKAHVIGINDAEAIPTAHETEPVFVPAPDRQVEDDRVPPGLRRGAPPNPNSQIVQLTPGGFPYLKSEVEDQLRRSNQNGSISHPRGTELAPDRGIEPRPVRGAEPAMGRGTDWHSGEGAVRQPPIILETSTHRSSTPIQGPQAAKVERVAGGARVEPVEVVGCTMPACRHPASYVCKGTGATFCVRHRATTNRTVPIQCTTP
ncbi:hypothetical protein MBRA_05682 [Methylobacterium brachiatum]|nr:hypothetical protein MBRA_05682 [Methylobacterium brachiatum]